MYIFNTAYFSYSILYALFQYHRCRLATSILHNSKTVNKPVTEIQLTVLSARTQLVIRLLNRESKQNEKQFIDLGLQH